MKSPHTINRYVQAFETMCNRDLKQAMYNECDVLLENVLLVLHGDKHTERRSTELKLFRKDFTRYYLREVFPETVRRTLAPFLAVCSMDLLDFARRVNINLSADFAGIDRPEKSVAESEHLARLVRKFGEGATLVHSTRDKDEVRNEVSLAIADLDENFFQLSLDRRRDALVQAASGTISEDELPRDILMVLVQNQEKLAIDEAGMRREIAFFLQAGSHSSGNSMVHAFHDIQQWCQDHPADRERLQQDRLFVQRCVHESMRLHPASPVAWRSAACPVSLADGASLSTDEPLLVDLMQANKDKDIFGDDAEHYNPHRSVAGRYPAYGLTFGIGVHTCFGRDLAGGELPKAGTNAEDHNYGIVTMLLQTLLDAGAEPDPNDSARQDGNTERQNWGYYPIIFPRKQNV